MRHFNYKCPRQFSYFSLRHNASSIHGQVQLLSSHNDSISLQLVAMKTSPTSCQRGKSPDDIKAHHDSNEQNKFNKTIWKVRSRVYQQKKEKRNISTAQVFRIFQKTFQAKRPTVASQHFCSQKLSIFRPATHLKNTRKIEKYFHFSFLDPVVMATSSPSAIVRAVSQSFSTEKCPTQTPCFCVRWENTIRCCTRYAIQAASVGKISTHSHTEPACVSLSLLQN